MNKNEVIGKMFDITVKLYSLAMKVDGLTDAQIKQQIETNASFYYSVQTEIYNFFVKEGLIKVSDELNNLNS